MASMSASSENRHRPVGMRRVRTRPSPGDDWETMAIGAEIQFETELGDVRVKWDGNTGRVRVYALGHEDVIDALDVQPGQSNSISVGLTGERVG